MFRLTTHRSASGKWWVVPEGRPLEIAPSGRFVLMEWANGGQYWNNVEDVEFVEALPEFATTSPATGAEGGLRWTAI